jgi:IMP dehydrogenase|tara:strand:+ start:12552 stop:13601 length:1050 start_codon:yes stop_codon:yes gene_type:complete
MNSRIKTSYAFEDVLLTPQYSNIKSRSEIILGQNLIRDNLRVEFPVISSPMDTVTESKMIKTMAGFGGIGIAHRYCSIEDQCKMISIESMPKNYNAGAAVGVTGDYLERSQALLHAGFNILCIDVAHGHHDLTGTALDRLRRSLGDDVHIMAGNVATPEGLRYLADRGANTIRVGIGGGSICSTRIQTGHGIPTLQSVVDCFPIAESLGVDIVADGGIQNSGDIVKALAAGASLVMLGSLLSGTDDTPGNLIQQSTGAFKEYRGMASAKAQREWRGKVGSREGVVSLVPYKGTTQGILEDLEAGIRSGLSYSGSRTLCELSAKASFILQTPAGQKESNTHVYSKGLRSE